MKKLNLIFLALLYTLVVNAVPTYNLQDGLLPSSVPTSNDALWTSMWNEFKAEYDMIDYNASGFVTPSYSQSGSGYGENAGNEKSIARFLQNCFWTNGTYVDPKYTAIQNVGAIQPWVDGGIWEWLGDYFYAVYPSFPGEYNEKSIDIQLGYAYNTQSFVQGKVAGSISYDQIGWSDAKGTPAYWQLAYMIGKGIAPTKSGNYFVGWNTKSDGTGTAVTSVSQLGSLSGTVHAIWTTTPTVYNLGEGGETITSNDELWQAFMPAYNAWYLAHQTGFTARPTQNITAVATFANEYMKDFMTNTNSPWKWLGDYILEKANTSTKKYLTEGLKEKDGTFHAPDVFWRFTLQAFFNCNGTSAWNIVASKSTNSWSDDGKYSVWSATDNFKFKCHPTREGYDFVGWYTSETGGTKITDFAVAQTYANLYARWERRKPQAFAFKRGPTAVDNKPAASTIIPAGETQTYYVEVTPADAATEGIEYSCTGPVTCAPVEGNKLAVTVTANTGAAGEASVTVTDTGTKKTKTLNLWVAGEPATEGAQVAIYAFDLDLKYYGGERKEYGFRFSTNTGMTQEGKLMIALKEDMDKLSSTPHERYGNWQKWDELETKYEVPIPTTSAKGHYEIIVKEADLQNAFKEKSDLTNIQPSKAIVWAVQVGAGEISNFAVFRAGSTNGSTGVIVSNTNPQSGSFGRLYGYFRGKFEEGTTNITGQAAVLPPYDLGYNTVTSEREGFTFDRVARIAIDSKSTLYITDKGHENPGIYVGKVHDYDESIMYIHPFFPKANITIDVSDESNEKSTDSGEESRHIYSIIKDKTSKKEIGSAFLAADTYTKDVSGELHTILFAYAKGHSVEYCKNKLAGDYGYKPSGTAAEKDAYAKWDPSAEQLLTLWTKYGEIPYHCIIEYDLGPTSAIASTYSADAVTMTVRPLDAAHHVAQTANIWATEAGMWICHNRSAQQNNNWAASLLFYGSAGRTYSSGDTQLEVNNYINGSIGAAFAINYEENLLVLNDDASNLLVFDVAWNDTKTTPTLTFKAAYHHELGAIQQMQFDYGGNLLIGGANGVSIVSVPGATSANNKITPSYTERYILSRHHQYDCIFTGKVDGMWDNRENWMDGFMPTSPLDDIRVRADMTVNVADAQAHSLFLEKNEDTYKKVTVQKGKALALAEDICWAEGGDPNKIIGVNDEADATVTGTEPLITLEPNASLTYTTVTGEPKVDVQIEGTALREKGEWQQIAVPFYQETAKTNFYLSWLYAWDAGVAEWDAIKTIKPMPLFRGYMLHQLEKKTYHVTDKLSEQDHKAQEQTLYYAENEYGEKGYNLLGNSWLAPIRIADIDFNGDMQKTIYIYTGTNENATDKNGKSYINGVYKTYPTQNPDDAFQKANINPLEAFFVKTTSASAGSSATLKYYNPAKIAADELAKNRTTLNPSTSPTPQPAPRRIARETVVQTRIKLNVTSEKPGEGDELYLFESDSYTHDFDNGYEATKMAGDAGTPYLTAVTSVGDMAVLATPSFENTMLNFRQGSSTHYTFHIEYNGEDEYYLEDQMLGLYTEIRTGNTYFFNATDDDSQRFRIVRKTDQGNIATNAPNVWTSDNRIFMENPSGEEVEICIHSVDGKMVQAFTTCERTVQVDVPITGVYTVQVRTRYGVETVKCIM